MIKALCLCTVACLATGCSEVLPPVDGPLASVIVYGVVSRPDGAPAPGVGVLTEARAQVSCADSRMDHVSVVTDAAGGYRSVLMNWGTQFTVCVALRVSPDAASGFAVDSVQRAPVVMRAGGTDSVRVDIRLRPSA